MQRREIISGPTGLPLSAKPQSEAVSPTAASENSDIYLPGILLFVALIAFGAVVTHVGLWDFAKKSLARRVRPQSTEGTRIHVEAKNFPKLQLSPRTDWADYNAAQEKLLHSYAWIDRTADVVQIPIGEAFARILSNGYPTWSQRQAQRSISPLKLQQERAGKEIKPSR